MKLRRFSSGPSTVRPSGCSPKAARSIRYSATDRGLVVGAVDLLDHDAALAVELLGVEPRAPDEVGQQVDRRRRRLGADGDVEGDEVVARVGVEHAAEALGGLVDVAVGRVLLAALEDEVLEEVRHPVLLRALGARAGVEGDEDRQRARAGQRDAVDRQPVGRRRVLVLTLRHCAHHPRARRAARLGRRKALH